ncbi:MAG: nucleotidyltransferase domain-containing protein [Candidatus Humimicrobiaceae bacterium]
MEKEILKKLKTIFKQYPDLKLVYLFGSQASGNTGPLSDYDFAFYIEGDKKKACYTSISLASEITKILSTDNVDTVILNHTDAPELKYFIIKKGKVIYEVEPYKMLIEPRILNEYFDFRYFLRKNRLTGDLKK